MVGVTQTRGNMTQSVRLFEPVTIGGLELRNRLMRSATAERAAGPEKGEPTELMTRMYEELALGGVGLIVTGHAYVRRDGKAHYRQAAIDDDGLVEAWRRVVEPAQAAGARVMMQINHCGAGTTAEVTPEPVSPGGVAAPGGMASRALRAEEIPELAAAFGRAAGRAKAAGLDGVQIHGAHGYLVSQFLTPFTNTRIDCWGGTEEKRLAFLRAVNEAIRAEVGPEYPVWIKLGTAGAAFSGLTAEMGARYAAACAEMGMGCVEISHAVGEMEGLPAGEGAFMPMARVVRRAMPANTELALVKGFATLEGMEAALSEGVVQMISMCQPLIAEPDLPNKLMRGETTKAACVRCKQCWPKDPLGTVGCRNAGVRRKLGLAPLKET